jgi:hypothetical protein
VSSQNNCKQVLLHKGYGTMPSNLKHQLLCFSHIGINHAGEEQKPN